MIGYITLGSNDIEKSAAFYDALLAELGASRFMEMESFIAWATNPKLPGLSITKPFDGNAATVGNGGMVALVVDSTTKVESIYAKAMELGATDEGGPGPRGDSGFYAGYFRHLDGKKLCVYCMSL